MQTRLRDERLKRGLTLNQVAQAMGVTIAAVSRYERGQRKLPVPMAKRLGRYYRVPWGRFYDDSMEEGGQTSGAAS